MAIASSASVPPAVSHARKSALVMTLMMRMRSACLIKPSRPNQSIAAAGRERTSLINKTAAAAPFPLNSAQ
jgi:hypothetical protein